MNNLQGRGILRWLGLACILIVYAVLVYRLHPTNLFGLTEDDSIYFSSAKALAEGQGYVLPSVPGTPPATKYPILYPWLLSWVWRWNPSFPANLTGAIGLNIAFGCVFLVATFLFLRRLEGIGDGAALLLTAVCAINPMTLIWSALVMSDVPFAALVLVACLLAARAIEKEKSTTSAAFAGVLSGLSFLMRLLGVPIAAALGLAMVVRGGWRKASVFAVGVLPSAIFMIWRLIAVVPPRVPESSFSCSHSWRMTWLYYTTYSGFWKADTIGNHVFWQTIISNASLCLLQPGAYFLDRGQIRPALLGTVLVIMLSAVAIRGLIRHTQACGAKPIHAALTFYLVPLVIWDYGSVDRFLMPFLPLILAGLWMEARYLSGQIRASLGKKTAIGEKIAPALFCLAGAALVLAIPVSLWRGLGQISRGQEMRGTLLAERKEAYGWLREHTPADARIIAYEDVSAFLYTGRQGLRPTIFWPAGAYRKEVLDSELACLTSSVNTIGAHYWIVGDDDFGFEWEPAISRASQREKEMEATLPLLFRSREDHVRIYGMAPIDRPVI